jgi:hypothetical protein
MEGVVTKERKSVQVQDVNRKAGTGVKRLVGKVKGLKEDSNGMQQFEDWA